MANRGYLTLVATIILLLWGPINESWPFWFAIRLGYLIIIPLFIWFLLGLIWKYWSPDKEVEERLSRTLAGVTSGVFIVMAILAAYSKYHLGNTLVVRSREGYEDVGDYIMFPGPDWGSVFIYTILAVIAFWYSISHPNDE